MQLTDNGISTLEKPYKVTTKKPIVGPTLEDFQGIINKAVYLPNWHNRPIDQPAVLSLNGVPVLSHQNTTAIIAAPGFGKSSICEAVAANYLNPDADCLGWKVHEDCKGVIVIDNERTNVDVWNSFNRMAKRAGMQHGDIVDVTIAGLRSIPRLTERLKTIEMLLEDNPCSLLILDGAGDLVTDTNDLPQAIDCRIFLREMTTRFNLSILTTLHPNPGSFKPRGHIGSEICREAECVLVAKKYAGESRMITSEFESGKNRNSSPANACYLWNDNAQMFLSVAFDGTTHKEKSSAKAKCKELVDEALPPFEYLKHSELTSKIISINACSEITAKRRITTMLEFGMIEKSNDGFYSSYL